MNLKLTKQENVLVRTETNTDVFIKFKNGEARTFSNKKYNELYINFDEVSVVGVAKEEQS